MTTPMFDRPEPERVQLSEYFATDHYRWDGVGGEKLSYTRRAVRSREQCQECVLYLHEHRGHGPLPRQTKIRRTLKRTIQVAPKKIEIEKITLDLCSAHAQLWRNRDGVD